MTRVTGDWIKTPHAQALCDVFEKSGHKVFFVGGCVRNDLLGVPISDLDLATDSRPDDVIAISEKAGLRAIPTGIEHGTVTVVVDEEPFEVTTFRKDIQTDGRRAVVAFSDKIEDDARRRDFTMNALYAAPDGAIHDPVGGLQDLKARRVLFIDEAAERIREDYLRILRFFRFHAWYGNPENGIDADGLAACAANLGGLETLSKERVGSEMLKILSATDPAPAMASMTQSGVLNTMLPGADATQLPHLVHLEAGAQANNLRRLALLGGEDIAERLRLSRHDQKILEHLREGMGSMMSLAELAYRRGPDIASDVAFLRAAQMGGELSADTDNQISSGANARFPIKPADLMPKLEGAALGQRLRSLEARWIASDFKLTREALLNE